MGDLFDGIQSARMAFSGDYLKAGRYLAKIQKIEVGNNRAGQDNVIVKMTCLHVFADGPQPDPGESQHRVGEPMSDCISTAQRDYFLPKLKALISKILNVPPDEVTKEVAVEVTSAAQPLKGLVIEVVGTPKTTVKNKKRIVTVEHRGQVPVTRIAQIVPAEILESSFPGNELQELEQRQQAFGIV